MTAAVSDFIPEPLPGKISSDLELTLKLRQNKKILLRLKSFSPANLIVVGFKLTVDDPNPDRQALKQLETHSVDIVVQNDWRLRQTKDDFTLYEFQSSAGSSKLIKSPVRGVNSLATELLARIDNLEQQFKNASTKTKIPTRTQKGGPHDLVS
jgi:hypothetical protein